MCFCDEPEQIMVLLTDFYCPAQYVAWKVGWTKNVLSFAFIYIYIICVLLRALDAKLLTRSWNCQHAAVSHAQMESTRLVKRVKKNTHRKDPSLK